MGDLEGRSRTLLNGDHRLALAAVIASLPREFETGRLVRAFPALNREQVSKEIRHFRDGGTLEKVRHGVYRRRHEAFWQACHDMAREEGFNAGARLQAVPDE